VVQVVPFRNHPRNRVGNAIRFEEIVVIHPDELRVGLERLVCLFDKRAEPDLLRRARAVVNAALPLLNELDHERGQIAHVDEL
jgi:hypothetical protein